MPTNQGFESGKSFPGFSEINEACSRSARCFFFILLHKVQLFGNTCDFVVLLWFGARQIFPLGKALPVSRCTYCLATFVSVGSALMYCNSSTERTQSHSASTACSIMETNYQGHVRGAEHFHVSEEVAPYLN